VVAVLFAWGTYSLWRIVSIGPLNLPDGLRPILAITPPVRRTFREAGLFVAYLVAIVLCLAAMDLIRGPQSMRNLSSPIAIE
jgi:hypothetical protein